MQHSHLCSRLKDLLIICLSLVVCVFLIDFFLFPILPDVQQYATFSSAEVYAQAPASRLQEISGSVIYRNASWKPKVGHWFSNQGDAPLITISESFRSNACDSNCSGRGVCNHDRAECRCYHGYTGEGCEKEEDFPCTADGRVWGVSNCGATCDKRKAFCYCGEGTKYPERQVGEACGFVISNGVVDWKSPDPSIYANSSQSDGWCNLDPGSKTPWKQECHCIYDGTGGVLCDNHVESFCINQCSGNGECRAGFCACMEGWFGIDCSVPSSLSSLTRWPTWLAPTSLPEKGTPVADSLGQQTLQLTVKRQRPLIYIYDLPAKLNSHLLEGRHFRLWCSTRTYDDTNRTIWTYELYGAELALLESLLASSHRTTNAEEADFFYIPTFEACARNQADSSPHTDMEKKYMGLRGYFSGAFHKRAYEHIKESYPYWNRSGGRDHIWMFTWDEGACSAPKEIWNSIMLVHWGNTNSKHNYSTTAYPADDWTEIPAEWRGNHPCYDPEKDIVLPAWKKPQPESMKLKLWARPREERPTLFYFNGNLGSKYEKGRPEEQYSMGLRQRLAEEFGSLPNINGQLGRQAAPDVIVISRQSPKYEFELSESRFCGVFPGDGWSGRMADSILHGCIPVIVQDGIHLPFENVLDYSTFAVRIAEDDLPRLVQILRGINDTTVDSMLFAIQNLWQRFTYHSTVKLEAQRQQLLNQPEAAWAREYNNLVEDDAFSTFIQVLHFKLGNRPSWQESHIPSGQQARRDGKPSNGEKKYAAPSYEE